MKIVEKIYKSFDEPVNPKKLGSIWVSFESGENRDGTSFSNIAKNHFRNIQGKVPIMVVISDGEPHHGGTDYVDNHAFEMTKETVRNLKQNVKMVAISIDKHGSDYLQRIYGIENFIVLKNPNEITQKLIFLTKSIASSLT